MATSGRFIRSVAVIESPAFAEPLAALLVLFDGFDSPHESAYGRPA